MEGIQRVQARIASIEARIATQVGRPAGGPLGQASMRAGAAGATSFQDALQQALGPTGLGAVDHSHGHGHGHAHGVSDGPLEPPAALKAYGNGRIPPHALAPLGIGNHRLYAPAAESFKAMRAAAAADGVKIGITDSYRSYDAQVDLAKRKGLYKDGGLAAVPGTSNHGWGLATDLDLDDRAQAWMRTNASRFGFVEDVPREPWHWTYRPASSEA